MIQKTFPTVAVEATGGKGVLRCIASVTGNVDLGNDIIVPGAFQGYIARVKSGQGHFPSLCFAHRADDLQHLLGKVTDMEELMPGDPRLPADLLAEGLGGLYVEAKYNLNTTAGRDGYEHAIAGDVAEYSFMFNAPDIGYNQMGNRLLKVIDPVIEVSHVLAGMNPRTSAIALKRRSGRLSDPLLAAVARQVMADIKQEELHSARIRSIATGPVSSVVLSFLARAR